MRSHIFTVALICSISSTYSQDEVGPYFIRVESIEKCADEGTKDFTLAVEYNAEKDTFSGVLYKRKDLGDNVQVAFEVQQLVGDEWKKEFSQNIGGVCTLIKAAPDAVQNLLDSIHFRDCPIPEGTNMIKDLKNHFTIPFLKTLRYGKRQLEVTFTDANGNRLGCTMTKGEVLPLATT